MPADYKSGVHLEQLAEKESLLTEIEAKLENAETEKKLSVSEAIKIVSSTGEISNQIWDDLVEIY